MQDIGSLGLVHWDDPEGWYGEGIRDIIVETIALDIQYATAIHI